MFATISRGLKQGIDEDQPTPMPSAPLTSTMGMMGQYHSGSHISPSSSRYFSSYLSASGYMVFVIGASLVKIYLAEALSLPPARRVPN